MPKILTAEYAREEIEFMVGGAVAETIAGADWFGCITTSDLATMNSKGVVHRENHDIQRSQLAVIIQHHEDEEEHSPFKGKRAEITAMNATCVKVKFVERESEEGGDGDNTAQDQNAH